jgi:DNA-binding NtrC family response regulator
MTTRGGAGEIAVYNGAPAERERRGAPAASAAVASREGDPGVNAKILVVDDDPAICSTFEDALKSFGCDVSSSVDGEDALRAIKNEAYELVFVDYNLPKADGLEILAELKAFHPETEVVMITGEGNEQLVRAAFKSGALDYITKPVRLSDLEIVVQLALERQRLRRENQELRRENRDLRIILDAKYSFKNIIGNTSEMRRIFDLVRRIAPTRSTVMITGDSGTGKELIARAIHHLSDRSDRSFVAVNCGAMPDSLLEDELFGHVRGAFTDAVADRIGRFEQANHGTLFLDEIGTMSQNLQVKLLRVLQEKELTPLGTTRGVKVDVRIIAATNSDLKEAMEAKRFREDLFYRLNVIHIRLPRLAERREDLPLLINYFLQKCCAENASESKAWSPAAIRCLLAYSWPGNVRQLENVVERAVALSGGRSVLEVDDLPEEIRARSETARPEVRLDGEGILLDKVVGSFEEKLVLEALERSGWVKTRAAKLLHIKRTTLIEKMKRLGIPLRCDKGALSQ